MTKSTRNVYRQHRPLGRSECAGDYSDEARFGKRVEIHPSGCWAYNGRLDRYGQFARQATAEGAKDREAIAAHRFAYETLVGTIPDGHHLHHDCLNPGCVNPAHLRPLSPSEHMPEHARLREAS